MKKVLTILIAFSFLLLARNDIPSCYEALKINNPDKSIKKELFILVDQTTPLDKKIMVYVYNSMKKFIKNGYGVTIVSFSSNANGKYAEIEYSGKLENLLPESAKYDIAKKALRKYQGCMNSQYKYAKNKATKALVRTLKGANKELPYSDIFKSLDDISKNIIKPSDAREKIVLLVSDMIEHSSITSFYHKGSLKRNISIKKELIKLKNSKYVADFDGAKVYVIGTGMTSKDGYRDSKTLKNLAEFWKTYFLATNAKLQAIGTPMLLQDIK